MFASVILGLNIVLVCTGSAYKIIPDAPAPVPVLKNVALEYKGPVFLIKETEDPNEPYIGLIVDGGIEMVKPVMKQTSVPFKTLNAPAPVNESTPADSQEDPENFAVLVTPETVAQAQISRTTTITIPLSLLLIGVSAKIPWLMVLKKDNHYDYFKTLIALQSKSPQRRRYRRSTTTLESGRLLAENKNYDMVYTEDEKFVFHDMCNNIIKELTYLNGILQRASNNVNDSTYPFDVSDLELLNNLTKLNETVSAQSPAFNENIFAVPEKVNMTSAGRL